jgi:AcrR family transcriptional regulator
VLGAARRVFAERGFEGATLTAIAAQVGVSPAALLRHAPTKDALFSAAMAPARDDLVLPMDGLSAVPGTADPLPVLRKLALEFVPFIESRIGETVVSWLRRQAAVLDPSFKTETLCLFDPAAGPSPPQRALALLASYFRRAAKAGRMRVRDPDAAALAFIASLQAYVFLHRVAKIADPPMPLPRYVDALLDIWTEGAIRSPKKARSRS